MKNKRLVVANWKKPNLSETLKLVLKLREKFEFFDEGEVVVCPNFVSLVEAGKILKNSPIKLGAQNVYWEEANACTGEIPPSILREANCEYVILGHFERRKVFQENDKMIQKKIAGVLRVRDVIPIVCIGETWDELKADRRDYVLLEQIQNLLGDLDLKPGQQIVVAYEPIWAIGTGNVIDPAEAEYAHQVIKLNLREVFGYDVAKNIRIIYGGSINSENVGDFIGQENIDGVLVGTASLEADEFFKIAKAMVK